MRRIVASLAVLLLTPSLASAQLNPLNPLSYAPLDAGQGLSPILTGSPTASIVTTSLGATFFYGTGVYNAVMTPQVGGPDIAVFTFTNINLGGLATALSISGTNPVAILSQQDISLIPIIINGNSGAAAAGGAGGVGASAGGAKGVAGSGNFGGGNGTSGGGGGNGGAGGNGAGTGGGAGGGVNGTYLVVGGSGGGGGSFGGGGGGGGAIEIGAVNAISFTGTTPIRAHGGAAAGGAGVGGTAQGGGGAGGFVYIHGKQVTPLPTQTFSVNGGNSPNLNGGGGGGGMLIVEGLQGSDPLSRGTPIEPTFVGSNFRAAGGQAGDGDDGEAGVVMMRPTLPIVTNYNIVLDGSPIILEGVGANLGTQLTYIVDRDLQVGTNSVGVQPGVARLGANEPLAPSAKLSIESSGTFQTGAFKQTVAELSGKGTLALEAGGTLAVGSSSTLDLKFEGQIVGPGTLEKAGSGTLIRRLNLTVPGTFRNASGTFAIDGSTLKAETAFRNEAGAEFQLLNLGSSIAAPTVTNLGRIVGSGDVEGDLDNQPGGTIRLMESDSQRYLGAVNNNAGVISLLGGTVEFTHPVTNFATTGGINGRGTAIFGGAGLTNNGFLAFSGGRADILGDVDNTPSGQVSTVGGSTSSFFGDFVNNGTVLTATGATTVFLGTQTGGGSFPGGGTVQYFGAIIPGNSPALVSYGGDVVFGPAATLKIELGGAVRGSMYDALSIAGNLTATNALEVSLINEFVPSIGQTFDILDWGFMTGQFSGLTLPALTGAAWDTSQLYANGTLKVVAPPTSGDFDGNGVVDANDLTAWTNGFGTPTGATRAQGDANGDGVVDGVDFLAWQRGLGQPSATATAAGVPEPCGLLLTLLGMAPAWAFTRKR